MRCITLPSPVLPWAPSSSGIAAAAFLVFRGDHPAGKKAITFIATTERSEIPPGLVAHSATTVASTAWSLHPALHVGTRGASAFFSETPPRTVRSENIVGNCDFGSFLSAFPRPSGCWCGGAACGGSRGGHHCPPSPDGGVWPGWVSHGGGEATATGAAGDRGCGVLGGERPVGRGRLARTCCGAAFIPQRGPLLVRCSHPTASAPMPSPNRLHGSGSRRPARMGCGNGSPN